MNLGTIIQRQHTFFNGGHTKNLQGRKEILRRLYKSIAVYEKDIEEALKKDLNKAYMESYMTEISVVMAEIKTLIKNLDKWSKVKSKLTPLSHMPGKSTVYREPFGTVLVLAPWNYPFQLAMMPVVGAVAGGNTVVVKMSRNSKNTNRIVKKIIDEVFDEEYVYCISEGITHEEILSQRYDMIFFTGSPTVGKKVMAAASKHLTPVVLELGGKSPCIVEKSGNLDIAAKRIAWGKFLNAGQTCVAPDYVLVDEAVKDKFLDKLKSEIELMYKDALNNEDYVHIINEKHFDRLTKYIDESHCLWGGKYDRKALCIAPTVLENTHWNDDIMQEEIFGPILPIISYDDIYKLKEKLKQKEKPLALYIFSSDKNITEELLNDLSFGGSCVNDVVMHVANDKLPFGGVGNSGMGSYHGKYSFETFTRPKAVFKGKNYLDIPLRYPPYTEKKFNFIKKILK